MTEIEFNELKEALISHKTFQIRILSDSMKPLFKTKDLLWIKALPKDFKPKKFDVFTYWNGQLLIAHYYHHSERALGHDDREVWIFKPLAAGTEDFPVRRENILGQVQVQFPILLKIKLFLLRR